MLEDFINRGDAAGYYVLLATIVLLSLWEGRNPRRTLVKPIRLRWSRNFSLFIISALVARWTMPVVSVEVARRGLSEEWGLLHAFDTPLWLNVLVGVLILDLLRYGQHWLSHRYALLWRVHRLHHTDQEFDFTTSLRAHPLELCWISVVNVAVVAALGLHPLTILLTEALSLGVNTWNHGNLGIPARLDRLLRTIVVTPDMHRVHHSALPREFNANLGGLFPWWDRLFGTYLDQPGKGHEEMDIGLPGYADEKMPFVRLLLDPFTSPATQLRPALSEPAETTR